MTPDDREPRIALFPTGGPMKSARISPSDYVATQLVAELADAWKESAENLDLTPERSPGKPGSSGGSASS